MYNEKLEQRKNEILQELENDNIYKCDEDFDVINFNCFTISKSEIFNGISFQPFIYFKPKELRLIAELYEVMQYLGEV